MTWFKVDDSFHSHSKVWATSPAALGLWVVAGSWSSKSLSDGFVPDHALARLLPGAESLAEELVAAGLWTRTKGGFRFHDWQEYNPSAEQVEAERGAAKERMRKLRAERKTAGQKGKRSGEQPANVPGNRDRTSGEVRNPDPNFLQKFSEVRPPASLGGADVPPPTDWRSSPALGQLDPKQALRNSIGRANALAEINGRKPDVEEAS